MDGQVQAESWSDRPPRDLGAFLAWAVGATRALADWQERAGVHGRLRPEALVVDDVAGVTLVATGSAAADPAHLAPFAFLAPEQTGRLARGVDERSDLYALGVIYYLALTGRLPFEAVDALDWVHCHLARRPKPPADMVPGLPAVVAEIILRLLAKQPEERYQTARGLCADLERCRRELDATGQIAPFPLGGQDIGDRLVVSGRLYGRQPELATLRAAFDRVRTGGRSELVCVTGEPGVGKSALIAALAAPVAEAGGQLVAGKFDPYRQTPYATIAAVVAELGRRLLAEPDEQLATWRSRLADALGSTAGALVDLAPVLGLVLDEREPASEPSPESARNRVCLAIRRFLATLARRERPLVLVLEGLHWADAGGIDLLTDVLGRDDVNHLLVVGAYRPREVPAGHHPLAATLAGLEAEGLAGSVALDALPDAALTELLADTLRTGAGRVAPLARVVAEKTGANPLFVGQFLHRLHQQGLLWFDRTRGAWDWHLDRIGRAPVTDNVVELVAGRVGLLAPDDRSVLDAAALLGDQFDVDTLCLATGLPAVEVGARLRPAVREHLVLADAMPRGYRWAHDKIRQATLSRLPAREIPGRRLTIGRALLAALPEPERDERLFELVEHLDAGAGLLTDGAERVRVAELNLAAAGRARRSGAQGAARRYAEVGLDLLPADAWSRAYQLAFQLHSEAAVAANLAGDRARVDELLDRAMAQAQHDLDRVEVLRLRVAFALDAAEFDEQTFALGLQGLALLGLPLPADPGQWGPLADAAVASVQDRLAGLRVEDVAGAAPMTDPVALAATRFIGDLIIPAQARGDLLALLASRQIALTLDHGPTGAAAHAFGYHATVLASRLDDDEGAAWCSRACWRLIDEFEAPDPPSAPAHATAYNVVSVPAATWYGPIPPLLDLLWRAHLVATERGDPASAAYARWLRLSHLLRTGVPLDLVAGEVDAVWQMLRESPVTLGLVLNRTDTEAVAALRGEPSAMAPPRTPAEIATTELAAQGALGFVSCLWLAEPLLAAYVLGDHARALALAETLRTVPAVNGTIWATERYFYHALTMAVLYEGADALQRRAWESELDAAQVALDRWAARGPVAFSHKALLVSAERARLAGDVDRAAGRYDQAIGAAREHGFTHVEAIASERAGQYAHERGDAAEAATYVDRARTCYHRWGAAAKVRQLDRA